jgi:hypothetical protein
MPCKSLFVIIGMLFLASCREEYDLQLESILPKLVVEANITNQKGPYLVRLTKSRAELIHERDQENYSDTSYSSYLDDGMKAVTDAEVFITDNSVGLTDTLVKCPAGIWHYYYDPINQKDWSYFSVPDTSILRGYYRTTRIEGKSGHTYTLTIKWQDKVYHSVSYLPEVPVIDSVHFNFTKAETGKEDYNIPLLYFKEPQNERNYYLFVTPGSSRVWPYSVLSDDYLKDYVNGLDVCHGVSPDYWMTDYPSAWMNNYFIEMHSLTKEGYIFYKALLQQFSNDGGAYSPTPATPPGNIDNGALGFFRTSSVTRIDFKSEFKK